MLLRPSVLNLFTSVVFSTFPIDQVLYENRSQRTIAHEPCFRFKERPFGRKFRYLTPRGAWGGLARARKKNNQGKIGGSEQPRVASKSSRQGKAPRTRGL